MPRNNRRTSRLDQPRLPGRSPLRTVDPDAFGRLSERIARFLGTGKFLVAQSAVIVVWVLWNIVVPKSARFDAYPFQFLTLVLSLQAAYAAPLILLAQNRQDDRDRANLAQDRDQNAMLSADAEYLTREVASLRVALGDVVTRDFLRAELRSLLEEFSSPNGDSGRDGDSGRSDRPKGKRKREREKRPAEVDPGTGTQSGTGAETGTGTEAGTDTDSAPAAT